VNRPPDRQQSTILIIDDLPSNLGVLSNCLAEAGYAVLVAQDGERGLAIAQSARPDLILLDVLMPEIDGFETCRRLKADAVTAAIPVIFLSALDNIINKTVGFATGGVDYITKPFQAEEMLARVRTHLAMHTLQQQLAAQNAQLQQEMVDRQQAEEALRLANQELARQTAALQAANAELAQYAYAVSHDLQAPLRGIHNYTDFLTDDLGPTLSGDQRAYLDGLGRAVHEAEELVRDLLELSRIDHQCDATEPIDLGVFLRTLVAALDLSPDVEVAWAADWPTIETDPILLRQIFQNLILNAVKFNRASPRRIALGWRAVEPAQYEFSIRDNGIGIAPRYQAQIFRVFQRLHTREEYEGTGIGLAIVQKAVTTLQGTVRVESTPGVGSTFFVAMPRQRYVEE
jgi:two-component system, sensor histidine kinase and response regulator